MQRPSHSRSIETTRTRAAALFACLAVGCAAAGGDGAEGPRRDERTRRTEGTASVAAVPDATLERIMALEDGRRDDGGELRELLRSGPPSVRARAALALGRFELEDLGAPATAALVAALDDPDPRVREQAAFGLGLRGDATVAFALLEHWQDNDPEVRAALVEAATRLVERALVPHVLRALQDPDPRVRAAAADGVQRWPWIDRAQTNVGFTAPTTISESDRVLAREIDAAVTARVDGQVMELEDYEVTWRALAALARRGAPSALPAFLRFGVSMTGDADVGSVEARIFAAQGLARLAANDTLPLDAIDKTRDALEALTADGDPRVVVEAVRGLGTIVQRALHSGTTVVVLGAALGHASAHVRLVAWEALGAFPDHVAVAHLTTRYEDEDVPPARAAALLSLVKLRVAGARDAIVQAQRSPSLVERKGAATAAAALPSAEALPLLLALADDDHPKVSAEALAGLGRHAAGAAVAGVAADGGSSTHGGDAADGGDAKVALDDARAKLRAALEARDSGVRLAAALALREIATAEDVHALQIAALSSTGDAGPETRFEAARTLARIPNEAARRTIARMAREDSDDYVRRVAQSLLAELGGNGGRLSEEPRRAGTTSRDDTTSPTPGSTTTGPAKVGAWRGANPRVTFETSRGDLVFELLPHDAPHHVANVLELIRRREYDSTTWHRVVPDFVVQGGDPRGDGNGGGTWRGADDSLRLEVTRRRYRTGSLGMPRNEDRDSGGRQIFVTHRPTPHLDGRYTIFGELREGFDVLQELVEGDTIISARVLD